MINVFIQRRDFSIEAGGECLAPPSLHQREFPKWMIICFTLIPIVSAPLLGDELNPCDPSTALNNIYRNNDIFDEKMKVPTT